MRLFPDSLEVDRAFMSLTVGDDRWLQFRRQMPVARHWAYFDHAAVAPLSEPARLAIVEWAEDLTNNGDANWKRWSSRVDMVRRLAARLVAADDNEIAIVPNTTAGINLVAEGFPWRPGDNVVFPEGEFPSNAYAWLNLAQQGVEVRQVPVADGRVTRERLAEACDHRTRILAVSWVGYATGWRCDLDSLAELVHRHGGYLFVDAIQGLGVFPLDVRQTPLDFCAADGHKWLLGPEGAGLFFMRSLHLDLLQPRGIGWNSVVHAGDYTNLHLDLRRSAVRYEGGTSNMPGVIGLGASLELLLSLGIEAISQRLVEITQEACRRLESLGSRVIVHSDRSDAHRSGIVSFELPGENPLQVRKRCLAEGVILSSRAGRLRIAPHVYTNDEDLDRLIAVLRKS